MSEWKKARIVRIEKANGQEFAYCTVEGESDQLRKTVNELKRARIAESIDVEFEVTIKKDKGTSKIDKYRPVTVAKGNTGAVSHQTIANNPTPPPNKVGIPSNNPYTFLPIDLACTVKDTPVWHDGSGEQTYSGELHCTLTALTPLLVGNQRFTVGDAIADELPTTNDNNPINEKKAILEPLRLTDGRVLLPGSSLKGMLRNQLAALLDAPMDRVKEHHYTYRPNLDFNNAREEVKYAARPAIIKRINGGQIEIAVLPDARSAVFRQNEKPQDAVTFGYHGGIDGTGILARAHADAEKKKGDTYTRAFVSQQDIYKAILLTIPVPVYQAYLKTQQVLADDKEGHLTAHPLNKKFKEKNIDVAQAIKNTTALQTNQLIYVEVELDGQNNPAKITSMGHHFRYRWAYRDSIRYENAIQPGQKTLRPELDAAAKEQDGKLTGAHLLFGFVGQPDESHKGKRNLDGNQEGIDKLAGRIAINHALSQDDHTFLKPENNHWVFLKILGQPKASAAEHYLKQPKVGLMHTYGDLPDQPGGELAGRKGYRHQATAATDPTCYEAADAETQRSEQSTLVRYVSAPGSTFRFTVRFARLRGWELGVLIAALNPHRLKDQATAADQYALKLGYGRPLGLGSVRISIDAVRLEGQSVENPEDAFVPWIEAARSSLSLSDTTIKAWLEALCYQGKKLLYPTATVKEETTIYNYHTNIRREYSKDRRKA